MRTLVPASLVLLISLAWPGASPAQQAPAPRGELRIVDRTQGNWVWITINVMEHLVAFDKDGQLIPKLATS